jgi:hypothetical protein
MGPSLRRMQLVRVEGRNDHRSLGVRREGT